MTGIHPSLPQPTRFIDPVALTRISSLELVARTVVEGFISGLHRSPYLGFSTDFAEHRQLVRRVFRPQTETEWLLVERLARETWRRLRLFRARARLEARVWQRWAARPVRSRPT